ncbi:hypothetical protein [Nostoc sp.]
MTTSNLYWAEIFLAGTRPASNGVSTTITPEHLQEIVNSYNPQAFRAPLIVSGNLGHDIGNYTDKTVSKSKELCHGIPAKLKLVGDRLYAGFEKVSRDFAQWIRDKQIHSFSSSFYLPNSHNNPYPGKWSLRHIAGLGTTPPACKGLAPPPEPPSDWCEAGEFESYAINFQDNEVGVISFDMYVGATTQSPWAIAADLFQRYREYLIESEDAETAEKVLPADQIAALRDAATSDGLKSQQILQLQMQVAQLQQDDDDDDDDNPSVGYEEMTDYKAMWKKSGMTPAEIAKESGLSPEEVSDICQSGKAPNAKQKKALDKVFASDSEDEEDDSSDMSEELEQKAADLTAREEALSNREYALERQEVSSYVEGLVKEGKLVSGRREDTITLLLNTPNTTEIEFSESLGKKTPRQALMADYASRKAWNFSEDIVVREQQPSAASFTAPAGYSVDGDSNKIYIKAIAYCESNKLDRNDPTDWRNAVEASMR